MWPLDTDTRRYFALSLVVAWPPLGFWLARLFGGDAWTPGVVWPVPLILVTGVAAVWWVFTSVVWKAQERAAMVAAGAASVGGWFLLPWGALRFGPWIGSALAGVGAPNPLGLLIAIAGAFAVSRFCARRISDGARRGPTMGLTVSLLGAAALSCLSVVAFQRFEEADLARLRSRAEWCHPEDVEGPDGKAIRREGCVELAATVLAREPANIDRVVDIYTFGCRHQFESGSCAALAGRHERGEGVSKDLEKALDFYSIGCASSYVTAAPSCIEKGRMMHEGLGMKQSQQGAYALWGLSCERKPDLCAAMGRRYETGDGVTQNIKSAQTLFDMACHWGDAGGCAGKARSEGTQRGRPQPY